jgi:hypothetical protein
MKHTIEFNLPNDSHLLKQAMRGVAYESCLDSIRSSLRSNDKHGVSDEETLESIRGAISEMYEEMSE